MSGVEIRPIASEELRAFHNTFMRNMHFGPIGDEALERLRRDFSFDRTLAAFDGEQIVGTAHSIDFELTVPGNNQVKAAGVTAVSVTSTHHRRGLLTQIMERQLREVNDRGEPLAILIASEAVIYGRFGYGVSSQLVDVEVETEYKALNGDAPADTGRVVLVDEDTADKVFPEVYERWRKERNGAIPRNEAWWEATRDGRKPGQQKHVIHEASDGTVDGYIRYTVESKWDRGLANSKVEEQDFITLTAEARCALWRHVLDADLVRKIAMGAQPVDDPIRWWLANPRALKVNRVGDFFWTRILDIPEALAARTYRAEGELVLDVRDALLGDGRYLLTIGANGTASCEQTSRDADLSLGIAELGSIYLGGFTASDIAGSGRIRELAPGALARADAAFSSAPKPWSATWF